MTGRGLDVRIVRSEFFKKILAGITLQSLSETKSKNRKVIRDGG